MSTSNQGFKRRSQDEEKIAIINSFAIAIVLFFIPETSLRVQAASKKVNLTTLSKPSDISTFKNNSNCKIFQSNDGGNSYLYSFSVKERGWVIIDGGHWSVCMDYIHLYYNKSLTKQISFIQAFVGTNDIGGISYATNSSRWLYYLDKGTYYICDEKGGTSDAIYGFFCQTHQQQSLIRYQNHKTAPTIMILKSSNPKRNIIYV